MGRIASFYYMRHQTMAIFAQELGPGMDVRVRAGSRRRREPCVPLGSRRGSVHVLRAALALPCLPTCARRPSYALTFPPCRPCAQALLPVLCAAAEYDELPVRHNEDRLNVILAQSVRWPVDTRTAGESGGVTPWVRM